MEIFIAMIFASLVTMAHNGTRNIEECREIDFKHSSCWEAKQMFKAGKWGCELDGREIDEATGLCSEKPKRK